MRIILFLVILMFQVFTLAKISKVETSAPSAIRKTGESWQSKINQKQRRSFYYTGNDVLSSAKPLSELDTSLIPIWTDVQQLKKSFEYVRDIQFLQDFTYDIEWRRSTWLFPDDGCYARAALAADHLAQSSLMSAKIFVFGNLLAETKNADQGYVEWWFHVAPIVFAEKELFVLDPALNPKEALRINDWLSKMGNTSKMRIAICTSTAYEPYSPCTTLSDSSTPAHTDQYYFLNAEWERLLSLGRIPADELGSKPPWL